MFQICDGLWISFLWLWSGSCVVGSPDADTHQAAYRKDLCIGCILLFKGILGEHICRAKLQDCKTFMAQRSCFRPSPCRGDGVALCLQSFAVGFLLITARRDLGPGKSCQPTCGGWMAATSCNTSDGSFPLREKVLRRKKKLFSVRIPAGK